MNLIKIKIASTNSEIELLPHKSNGLLDEAMTSKHFAKEPIFLCFRLWEILSQGNNSLTFMDISLRANFCDIFKSLNIEFSEIYLTSNAHIESSEINKAIALLNQKQGFIDESFSTFHSALANTKSSLKSNKTTHEILSSSNIGVKIKTGNFMTGSFCNLLIPALLYSDGYSVPCVAISYSTLNIIYRFVSALRNQYIYNDNFVSAFLKMVIEREENLGSVNYQNYNALTAIQILGGVCGISKPWRFVVKESKNEEHKKAI